MRERLEVGETTGGVDTAVAVSPDRRRQGRAGLLLTLDKGDADGEFVAVGCAGEDPLIVADDAVLGRGARQFWHGGETARLPLHERAVHQEKRLLPGTVVM